MGGLASVVPPAVRWIVRTLEEAGFETWAVGGAVRDSLLGIPSGDWDLTTRARPSEIRRTFRRTVPVGIEHGTVGVLARDGTMYEVTTFRRDVETDGRHAVVSFADHVEEDLARRDFTINAVAWHPLRDEILDPFGGVEDLAEHRLRTVGEPEERFREDHLRVLRALRFAGRFRLRIDPGTWEALRAAVPRLRSLSAERIRDELLKILEMDPSPSTALALYADAGVLDVLYPELLTLRGREGGADRDSWTVALETLDRLPRGRTLGRLAILLRDLDPASRAQVLVRLRLSKAQTERVCTLAEAPPLPLPDAPEADLRRWLHRVGASGVSGVARLELARARAHPPGEPGSGADPLEIVASWRRARATMRSRPPLSLRDLALDGRGLIALGMRPGPDFGPLLEELLQWVLDDPSRNEPETLARRAIELAGSERTSRADEREWRSQDG